MMMIIRSIQRQQQHQQQTILKHILGCRSTLAPLVVSSAAAAVPTTTIQQPHYSIPHRQFGTGSRGSRGHGWYINYRKGTPAPPKIEEVASDPSSKKKKKKKAIVQVEEEEGQEDPNEDILIYDDNRHLQGEYYNKIKHRDQLNQWNDAIFQLNNENRDYWVYLDVELQQQQQSSSGDVNSHSTSSNSVTERLYMELNPQILPKISENFIGLVANTHIHATKTTTNQSNSSSTEEEELLSYYNTKFYRIEKNVGVIGGDILTNNGINGRCLQHLSSPMNPLLMDIDIMTRQQQKQQGSAGTTIEPTSAFYHLEGIVTMICPKVNCIDSRFLILSHDSYHLDGYCIPFGRLHADSLTVVQNWHKNIITQKGKPLPSQKLIIKNGSPSPLTHEEMLQDKQEQEQKKKAQKKKTAVVERPEAQTAEAV